MQQIKIRELRQHASAWLRKVQAGERFEVTDRGRPVALLVPLPQGGVLDHLIASGEATPAEGDLLDLGPPIAPMQGVPLPSEILEIMRADER
ncbi:MAG: type II toxin-antitoxin system prevent-host-death family antitoxin [Dehalococcoidia bacterium]|nr:type II toxin-antitoxin system prevent-host-death family antitoxin [Dehalococcoidia bacterium]